MGSLSIGHYSRDNNQYINTEKSLKERKIKSKKAITSFYLGIIGMLFSLTYIAGPLAIPLGITGVILGFLSLSEIKKSDKGITGRAYATIGIIFCVLSLALTVMIHLPGFLKYQERAKQSEAKQALWEIYNREQDYYEKHGTYAANFSDLGWNPEHGNTYKKKRYAYFLGHDVIQPQQSGPYALPREVKTYADDKGFLAAAVGNIDKDMKLDVWVIDDQKILHRIRDDVNNE